MRADRAKVLNRAPRDFAPILVEVQSGRVNRKALRDFNHVGAGFITGPGFLQDIVDLRLVTSVFTVGLVIGVLEVDDPRKLALESHRVGNGNGLAPLRRSPVS